MPLPAPVEPPAPDLHCTSHILHPPGEWWKVRHSAEPEAEAPIIWSEEEDEDGKQATSASVPESHTFKQAMYGQQSDGWQETTLEYNTLVETGTFKIVNLPVDQKAIESGCQVKHNADGSIECLKARIIAKGLSMSWT